MSHVMLVRQQIVSPAALKRFLHGVRHCCVDGDTSGAVNTAGVSQRCHWLMSNWDWLQLIVLLQKFATSTPYYHVSTNVITTLYMVYFYICDSYRSNCTICIAKEVACMMKSWTNPLFLMLVMSWGFLQLYFYIWIIHIMSNYILYIYLGVCLLEPFKATHRPFSQFDLSWSGKSQVPLITWIWLLHTPVRHHLQKQHLILKPDWSFNTR